MKKNAIILLIFIMSTALIGSITLQFHWVNTAIKTSNENFKQDAHELLESVVYQLEQYETIYEVEKAISEFDVIKDNTHITYDSLGNAEWKEEQKVRFKKLYGHRSTLEEGYVYEVEEEATISKIGTARRNKLSFTNADQVNLQIDKMLIDDLDTFSWLENSIEGQIEKLTKKSDMISFIIKEILIRDKKNIEDRINAQLLDSLIANAVAEREMPKSYYYIVCEKKKLITEPKLTNTEKDNISQVLESEFKANLFPTDIFGNSHMLHLYFPNKNIFIIKKIWFLLSSSITFILLIIFSFAFAVRMIFKQKQLSEITNDFISNMTHELKTPVATISLACEALLDPDMRRMSISQRYLNTIKEENNRLSDQIERVLQIARLDKKEIKLKITSVNIGEIIQAVVKNIALQVESRGGEIKLFLQAKPIIKADKVHLTNVIYNLLDNANKYSPEKPKISICLYKTNYGIKIVVSDKGQGIPKESLSKIFDKFYRIPTSNLHNVKGFGLGLSYVKNIVEAQNGSITVKSELGKGSSFTILLSC